MKKTVFILILSVVFIQLVGMKSVFSQPKPIPIGVLYPFTGYVADWGKKQEVSLRLVIEDLEKQGWINGVPFKFIKYDTEGKPETSAVLARKLAREDKVFAIIGPFMSGECEVGFPQANEAQCPIVSASSAKETLAPGNRPWTFQIQALNTHQFKALEDWTIEKGYKKVALLGDIKDGWSKSILDLAQKSDRLKDIFINQKDPLTFTTGIVDFSPIVTKLKGMKADAVFLCGLYKEGGALAKEMIRQGVTITGIAGSGSSELHRYGGDEAKGWVVSMGYWVDNPDPIHKTFRARFEPVAKGLGMVANPEPDLNSTNFYDIVMVFAKICRDNKINGDWKLEQARQTIRDGFAVIKNYKGVSGTSFTMDPNGQAVRDIFILKVARANEWEKVK